MTVINKLYIAGARSFKDLCIKDLTIPLRLNQSTDIYEQAHQLFTDSELTLEPLSLTV